MSSILLQNLKSGIHFNPNTPLLVACSGGRDSMALLHGLIQIKCTSLEVAHCNFQLRGDEADKDEIFVREFSESNSIPFHSIRFDTEKYAQEQSVSIQMAARNLRYEWMENIRKTRKLDLIVTAHHLDDQAETILFNIIQGTGINGLKGMLSKNGTIIRPLLHVSRNDIDDYINLFQVSYREDASNASVYYKRNFIRHEIFPLLEQINPSVKKTFSDFGQKMLQTNFLYQEQIERIRKKVLVPWKDGFKLLTKALLNHPSSDTLFFEILSPYGFSQKQISEILCTVRGVKSTSASGQQFLSDNYRLVADRACIYILPVETQRTEMLMFDQWPGQIIFNEFKIDVRRIPVQELNMKNNPRYAYFDASQVIFPILIRYPQTADYFYPFGMGKNQHPEKPGKKKLSKYFKDIKMPVAERALTPVVFLGEKAAWLVGQRIDDRFKVTNTTKDVIALVITKGFGS